MRNLYGICMIVCTFAVQAVKVHHLQTKGGIGFWFVQDKNVPVISMKYSFKGGGTAYVNSNLSGLNSITSQLLMHGAGKRSSKELRELLAQNSISIYFCSDKDYFYGGLRTTLRNKDTAILVLKDILYKPLLPADKLDLIKSNAVVSLRSSLKNPEYLLHKSAVGFMYGTHQYGISATEQSINNIKSSDIKSFLANILDCNSLQITLCGNLTPEQAENFVDSIFAKLPRRKTDASLPVLKAVYDDKTHILRKKIPQSVCSFHHKGIGYKDKNILIFMLLNHVLGGDFTSRLIQEIREKHGYAYSVHTSLDNSDYVSHLSGRLGSSNHNINKAIQLIKKEFAKMSAFGITESELQDAKRALIGREVLNLSSTSAIADKLLFYKQNQFPSEYINMREKMLNEIKLSEVNKFARSFFNTNKLVFFIVGDPVDS